VRYAGILPAWCVLELETRNSKLQTDEIIDRAKRVKLLLMDCDGVITDGRIWLTPDGDEQKAFHARDGPGNFRLAPRRLAERNYLRTRIQFSRTPGA
jgi:hypothetical protein